MSTMAVSHNLLKMSFYSRNWIILLKQSIGYVYVTVDFICIGWFEREPREESENYKMKNSCSQWDLIPVPLVFLTDALSIAPCNQSIGYHWNVNYTGEQKKVYKTICFLFQKL